MAPLRYLGLKTLRTWPRYINHYRSWIDDPKVPDFEIDPAIQAKAKPTSAQPGSAEKVEVMRLRVIAGEEIFHQRDRFEAEDEIIGSPGIRITMDEGFARLVAAAEQDERLEDA